MSVGPPKSSDKGQSIKSDPSVVAYPIYGYTYQQQYHKDMKVNKFSIASIYLPHNYARLHAHNKIHIKTFNKILGKIRTTNSTAPYV